MLLGAIDEVEMDVEVDIEVDRRVEDTVRDDRLAALLCKAARREAMGLGPATAVLPSAFAP